MTRIILIVAALLLGNLESIAAAADVPEHQSKNARKVIATLNSIGINSKDVRNLIEAADARVDRNYLYLNEQEGMGGKIALRYRLNSNNTAKSLGMNRKLELHYAPKDSHLEVNVHTNGIMASYHWSLE